MKRLSVVVVTNLFPSTLRPHRAAYNRQQFQRLAEKHDVTVLVAVGCLEWVRNFGGFKIRRLKQLNIRYFPFFYVPGIAVFMHAFYMFCSLVPQIPFVYRTRPDVLLASWGFPDAVASLVWCRILGIPAVIKVHGSDINVKATMPGQRAQICWALRKAGAVVAVSDALCQRLINLGIPKEKIRLIYNGVDLDVFVPEPQIEARKSLGIKLHQRSILFVGNLEITKGCKELVLSFSDLFKENENVHLYFIGRGRAEKELKGLAGSTGCLNNVHFWGEVEHADLTRWYNAADLICLPSYNEGVPNVLLEAMACGLPVVATNVGGIPEIVSAENGLLVKRKDTKGLAVALRTALAKNWDAEAIIGSIQHYSWDRNLAELEQVLFRIAGGPKK